MRKPPVAVGPASKTPPKRPTRSRIPTNPKPGEGVCVVG